MTGITLFWCGITSVFLVISLGAILKHRDAQRRFASTQGVVLSSEVKTERGDGDSGPTYFPCIKYRYSVGGRQYVSTRYAYGMGSTSEFGYVQTVVSEHPPGRKVRVWYDPDDPGEAILQLEVPGGLYFLLLFLQPFLIVALGLIAYTISIPFAHARARRFMSETTPLFGPIPGWGTATQNARGITIRPARSPLRVPIALGGGYALTCFAGIFIVGFLLDGFGDPSPETIFRTLLVAVAVGLAAMLFALLHPSRKATLEIDTFARRLSLTSPTRDFRVGFAEIESWTMRTIDDPKGGRVNHRVLTRPLLGIRTNRGEEAPIRVFGTPEHMPFIARKVGEALAELTDRPLREAPLNESTAVSDLPEPPENPLDLLRQVWKMIRKQKHASEQYKDIM